MEQFNLENLLFICIHWRSGIYCIGKVVGFTIVKGVPSYYNLNMAVYIKHQTRSRFFQNIFRKACGLIKSEQHQCKLSHQNKQV